MDTDFYVALYKGIHSAFLDPLKWSFLGLHQRDKRWLKRGVTRMKIKTALFQMDGNKTLGPDGISAVFLQKYWNLIGESVISFVQKNFFTSSFPSELNGVLITMIPKITSSENLSQFRLISLCNVIVKLISKIIANQLKPLISILTTPNQCSFVSGRQTADNVIMVQALVHSFKTRRGKRGGLIAKIDREKVYD